MFVVMIICVVAAAWFGAQLLGPAFAQAEMRKGFFLAGSAEAASAEAVIVKEPGARFAIRTTTKPLVEARVITFDTAGQQWRFTARGHPLAHRLRFQISPAGLFRSADHIETGGTAFDDKVTVVSTDADGMRGVLDNAEVRALVLELVRLSVSLVALMNDATLVVQWRHRAPTAADVQQRLLLTQQLALALDRQFDARALPPPSTPLVVPPSSGSPIGVRGL